MLKKITNTTAASSLGIPPGHKLLRVASGQYRDRLVALIQPSAGEIAYTYADRPYLSWSPMTTIVNDAADEPFDCIITDNSDIVLVYSETGTKYLVTRKLAFGDGVWSVGAKQTIFNGDVCLYPSIAIEPGGTLWISWSRMTGGLYRLYIKSSSDGGVTWGTGPSDSGTALNGSSSSVFSKLCVDTDTLYAVYTEAGVQLSVRSLPIGGGSWSGEYNIATGILFDEHFDAAFASDGRLGVVWDNEQLQYREYDGAVWGAITTLDTDGGAYPQLYFTNTVPCVLYLSSYGTNQQQIRYISRHTGIFSPPTALDKSAGLFDTVLLYDASSSVYADLTASAADADTGDVFHPQSNALLNKSGDCLYVGMNSRFRYMNILLSVAGSGGTVTYTYWDGNNWIAFTPTTGLFNFDAVYAEVLLWEDSTAISQDWQKHTVHGDNRFWIKIEVLSDFTVAPIGSQITAISDIQALILRR